MNMTVRQLRKMIEAIDDDTLIVTPSHDHSYRLASVFEAEAEKVRGGFMEYHGEEYAEDESNPVIKVLVVE